MKAAAALHGVVTLGAGVVVWLRLGPWQSAVAVLLVLLFMALRAGWVAQRDLLALQAERKQGPSLELGEPEVITSYVTTNALGARSGYGKFVVVPVTNDSQVLGASDATAVHATLAVTTLDGVPLVEGEHPARWQHTPQPPDRSPYAATSAPDLAETTIPPNGRPYRLDTLLQLVDEPGAAYIWNNESIHFGGQAPGFKVEHRDFLVSLTVAGANIRTIRRTMRVELLFPELRARWIR